MAVTIYREYDPPIRDSSWTFPVALTSQADTDIFKTSVTLAAGDVIVYQDGVLDGNIDALPVEIGTSGVLVVTLSDAEMTADQVTVKFHDVAGSEWQDLLVDIWTVEAVAVGTSDLVAGDEMDLVNAPNATALSAIAAAVWAYATRTLTSISAVVSSVWSYATRTLTQTVTTVGSSISGNLLTITRGDTLSASMTDLGALTGYVSIDFTVKERESDTDAQAILRVRLNASGTDDGLLRVNGAAASSSTDGSITIDDAPSGDITIAVAETVTDDLAPRQGLYYDIQLITATAVTTLATGTCNITADVTRAVS